MLILLQLLRNYCIYFPDSPVSRCQCLVRAVHNTDATCLHRNGNPLIILTLYTGSGGDGGKRFQKKNQQQPVQRGAAAAAAVEKYGSPAGGFFSSSARVLHSYDDGEVMKSVGVINLRP